MSVQIKTAAELEGKNVPSVVFHTRQDDAWVDVSTDDLFKGKTVVVFSLPGAFTPTCSSTHLPRYNELATEFKKRGVDSIVCISVNDTFVMNAWLADQDAENITVVPDGNGEFTKGMGMLVSKEQLGFGDRSWRYSMLVKDGKIEKFDKVLIKQPADATEHFRDPQIFDYKGQFYAIVGAQNHDKHGFIKLYKAVDNDVENWVEVGDLDFDGTGSEYMIECPNLVFVDGKPVLLYSPQGLDKAELDYNNIYPNTYKIFQDFDTEKPALVDGTPIINLDYGFEAYATQGFNTPDGRALIVSWIGLPDVDYPTDKYDYQGAMSLVKELSIKDGKLYQYPVEAITSLRASQEDFSEKTATTNTYELELNFEANSQTELVLFANQEGNGLSLTVDTENGKVILDRSKAGEQYATDFGTSRECTLDAGQAATANIFVDNSIVEIFFNKGEKVFTSRVFPSAEQTGIKVTSGNVSGHYFDLKY